MHVDEALVDFKRCQPQAVTHIKRVVLGADDINQQPMSSDALCTTLPYAELEGLIPYDRPSVISSATVGSGYSPTKAHWYNAWVATWKGLNCREPSSWRTPSPSPPQSTTPLEELNVHYSFRVQQNLIDPMFILWTTLV
jgi:hypothetical protein